MAVVGLGMVAGRKEEEEEAEAEGGLEGVEEGIVGESEWAFGRKRVSGRSAVSLAGENDDDLDFQVGIFLGSGLDGLNEENRDGTRVLSAGLLFEPRRKSRRVFPSNCRSMGLAVHHQEKES